MGNVPRDGGTDFFAASAPAMASMTTAGSQAAGDGVVDDGNGNPADRAGGQHGQAAVAHTRAELHHEPGPTG